MPELSLLSISGLAITLPYITFLGAISKGLRNNPNLWPYFLHDFVVLLWGLGCIFLGITNDISTANEIWKWTYSAVIFIPVFFYHGCLSLNNTKANALSILIYAQGLIFLIIHLNNGFFTHLKYISHWNYYPQGGTIFYIHAAIWFLIVIYGHIELFKFYKRSINKFQNLLLLIISPMAFAGGATNFFGFFGISFYPIGNFLIGLYSIIATYAILRHEFLDIKIIIRKGLVYSVLVSLMTLSYIVFVVAIESLLQNTFGYRSVLVKILTAFGFGLTLIPLRNRIQKFVDHYFFKGSPEELSDQIEKYSVQAQASERHKTAAALAGSVAHEIRNPLTAIHTFLEKFPEMQNDPEFRKKFHTIVSHEVQRIKNLSTDLMNFAKPTELRLSDFNIHEVLDDVLLLIDQKLRNQNIKVNKQFYDKAFMLTGDKDQLKQVFLNLILNAVDAMEDGGALTVSSSIIAVSSHLDPLVKSENDVMITITDTGCGISPENLKKLFEPFFTTKHDGTGLGLSICKRIIETHGGRIDVKSSVGKGAAFAVVLPIKNS